MGRTYTDFCGSSTPTTHETVLPAILEETVTENEALESLIVKLLAEKYALQALLAQSKVCSGSTERTYSSESKRGL